MKDLNIVLEIDDTTVNYIEGVHGKVSIEYDDGTPFQGNVTFAIQYELTKSFTTGYEHEINGETTYHVPRNAIVSGLGRYSIRLHEIYDSENKRVADNNDLKTYYLLFDVI